MNRGSPIVACHLVVAILVGFVLATASPEIGFAQSNLAGTTWKLNLEQSKFNPGPAPRSSTLTYEAVGQGFRVTNDGIDARGNPTKAVFGPYLLDGKPHPVTGVPDYDASSYKIVNNSTVEMSRMKDGKAVQTVIRVLSGDDKTLTFTVIGVNASGQQINNVAVYDKQ